MLPKGYYSPGFIAAFAAYLCNKGAGPEHLTYASEQNKGYLAAEGLFKALWGVDDYQYARRNAGVNYAPLTPFASQSAVDRTPDCGMRREMMSQSFATRINELWVVSSH